MEAGVGQQESDLAVTELLVCGTCWLWPPPPSWSGLSGPGRGAMCTWVTVPAVIRSRFSWYLLWVPLWESLRSQMPKFFTSSGDFLSTVDHFPWGLHLPQLRRKVPAGGLGDSRARDRKAACGVWESGGIAPPSCPLELCLRPSWRSGRAPWKGLARFLSLSVYM